MYFGSISLKKLEGLLSDLAGETALRDVVKLAFRHADAQARFLGYSTYETDPRTVKLRLEKRIDYVGLFYREFIRNPRVVVPNPTDEFLDDLVRRSYADVA